MLARMLAVMMQELGLKLRDMYGRLSRAFLDARYNRIADPEPAKIVE